MYKIRPLFTKYQKELVAFANTDFGRNYISQFGGKELKEKYPIIKVTPDGIHQNMGGGFYRAIFYPKSPYIQHLSMTLTMMDIANENKYEIKDPKLLPFVIPHFMGETRKLQYILPKIYLDTSTFNPDPVPESTSTDGVASRTAVNEALSTIKAGAGNGSSHDRTHDNTWLKTSATTDQYQGLARVFWLFDSSSLTSSAVISSATFSWYGIDKIATLGKSPLHIVSSTPASNTAIQNSDYGQTGSTSFGSVAYDSFSTTAYNDISLNASGISNISTTGISKFAGRTGFDLGDAVTWANQQEIYHDGIQSDNGTNKPKLVVNFTLSSGGPIGFKTLLGVGQA